MDQHVLFKMTPSDENLSTLAASKIEYVASIVNIFEMLVALSRAMENTCAVRRSAQVTVVLLQKMCVHCSSAWHHLFAATKLTSMCFCNVILVWTSE